MSCVIDVYRTPLRATLIVNLADNPHSACRGYATNNELPPPPAPHTIEAQFLLVVRLIFDLMV